MTARTPAETPLMRQYLDVKERHPDSIVFFRLGDFYEMFFEDAVIGARLLEANPTVELRQWREGVSQPFDAGANLGAGVTQNLPPPGDRAGDHQAPADGGTIEGHRSDRNKQ